MDSVAGGAVPAKSDRETMAGRGFKMQQDYEYQKHLWAEERKKHNLKYPDNNVVRYLHKNFSDGAGKNILDFGCGSGRHAVVMADMGFSVYCADYNDVCLELTREKLDAIKYTDVHYLKNEWTDIPLPSESMDAIVAWGIFMLHNQADCDKILDELYRVLRGGGSALADFRSKDDDTYGKGTCLESGMFRLPETAGNLAGMHYKFFSEEEVRTLYGRHGFVIENIEKHEFLTDNLSRKNSHYHVWAKKG